MAFNKWKTILGLLMALTMAAAQADGSERELGRAARLHLGGNTAQAIAIWKELAEKGNVDAAYNLGAIHYAGDGVPRDYAAAIKWYRVAAERGDRASQQQLGFMYQAGEGVPADEAEAHRWFVMNRAAHDRHVHATQMQRRRDQAAALASVGTPPPAN